MASSQGSSFLATLGFAAESLWDSEIVQEVCGLRLRLMSIPFFSDFYPETFSCLVAACSKFQVSGSYRIA